MNAAAHPARPGPVLVWVAAARPTTLWAGVVPVVVGAALAFADGHRGWLPAVAALVGAVLIQVGTNFVNDYADFQTGADATDRLGPARAVARGWLSAREVARGAAIALACAGVVGVYLTWVAGWPILALGLLSLGCAVAYTAGPHPLAYHGLGDLFVLLFFGFGAVCGTYFVLAGEVTAPTALAGAAVGALATAILVVNNLRDRAGDARAGKRTLAVRLGATFARAEYAALLLFAYASCAAMGWWWPLASAPLAVACVRGVWRDDGAGLNAWLGSTARLELVFGALLVVDVLR